MEKQKLRKASELLSIEPFHTEIKKEDNKRFNELLGFEFKLLDATIIRDMYSKYGEKDTVIMLIEDEDGKRFKTITSSSVVNEVEDLINKKAIPCIIEPYKVVNQSGREYFTVKGKRG